MREAMDGTSLKLRNLLLWECCIWRNTVDLQGFLVDKVLVLLAPCSVIVTWHLHIRMFFHLFHHWNDLFLKMGLLRFRIDRKKTEWFFSQIPLFIKPLYTVKWLQLFCKSFLLFSQKLMKREFFYFYKVLLDPFNHDDQTRWLPKCRITS